MAKDISNLKNASKNASGGNMFSGGGPLDDAAVQKLEEKIFTAMESQAQNQEMLSHQMEELSVVVSQKLHFVYNLILINLFVLIGGLDSGPASRQVGWQLWNARKKGQEGKI